MWFVAIYRNGNRWGNVEFEAEDWNDALTEWSLLHPYGVKLHLLALREGFDWQAMDGKVDMDLSP